MANITVLSRMVGTLQRNVDIESNTLVVTSIRVGGATNTELTKVILDKLVTLQNGSDIAASLHHHDGLYFTETELASTANGTSGASLIGIDQDPAFTNISGANAQALFESIDTALSTVAGADKFVKVSAADTTSGYLNSKISAGAAIGSSITNPAGNEVLDIFVNVDDSTIEINTDALRLKDGGITNAKINASAAIDYSKLAALTSGNILVGSAGNVATSVVMSSEASIIASGAVTLSNAAVIAKVLTGFTSGAGTIAATDSILAAIQKADGNIAAHIADASDAHDASAISSVAAGNLAATDVQAALNELDTDKLALAGGTMSGAIAMGASKITGLAAGSANGDAIRYEQLQTVIATINGLEFQDSALDYVVDNTAVPATEVTGNRYILSADGGAPNAAYDGASAGDIVQFNGTIWVATTPTTGMFISADDEPTLLYYWGGAAWTTKLFESTTASTGLTKVGVDVRLADAAENASGIQVSSGAITLNDLGAFSSTDLSEGTNLYFTEARVRATVLTGLDAATNGTVAAADSILVAAGKLQANQADLTTLSGSAQGAVNHGAFTGALLSDTETTRSALQAIETAHEEVDANVNDLITLSGVAENATNLGAFTGSTITDGSATIKSALQELETAHEAHVNDTTQAHDASAVGYTPAVVANWDSSTDPGETDDALDQLASRMVAVEADNDSSKVEEIMVAGESFAANTSFYVRIAISGETAGRIYKADKGAGAAGAETNTIYTIGLAQNRTGSAIVAGSNIPVVKVGLAILQSADAAFTAAQDEGLPVYIGAAGAFTLSPTTATNDATVLCGNVKNVGGSSAIEVCQRQIIGISA